MGTETAITGRRGQLGITQAEAAAKADISVATWRRFEQSPGLGYRADTIRGVLRALRLSREELVQLLDGQGPAAIENPESAQHHANWNALWKKSTWPSITPRMAAAIQSELDSGRDILESDLANGTLHPEDSPLLHEFDLRVFIELGHNPVWFHAIVMRLVHLVDAMNKGQLIDESCECFADAVLFAAAVREAAALWDDQEAVETWHGYNDGLETDSEYRWDSFISDLDDRMPYREWDCVFPEYRKARLLLDRRPPKTWFDELMTNSTSSGSSRRTTSSPRS